MPIHPITPCLLIFLVLGWPVPADAQPLPRLTILVAELTTNDDKPAKFELEKLQNSLDRFRKLVELRTRNPTILDGLRLEWRPLSESQYPETWKQKKGPLAFMRGSLARRPPKALAENSIYFGDFGGTAAHDFNTVKALINERGESRADSHQVIIGYALLLQAWQLGRLDLIDPIADAIRTIIDKAQTSAFSGRSACVAEVQRRVAQVVRKAKLGPPRLGNMPVARISCDPR